MFDWDLAQITRPFLDRTGEVGFDSLNLKSTLGRWKNIMAWPQRRPDTNDDGIHYQLYEPYAYFT
jgi:hypothetical protein